MDKLGGKWTQFSVLQFTLLTASSQLVKNTIGVRPAICDSRLRRALSGPWAAHPRRSYSVRQPSSLQGFCMSKLSLDYSDFD